MKSRQKMNGSIPQGPRGPQQVEGLPEHYQVKRVFLQAELELYDPETGKVTGCASVQPMAVFEAEFSLSIADLLTKANLQPKPYIPQGGKEDAVLEAR